jgi:hypothetical protein
MYKDKVKQREAVRRAVTKHRQGITSGITEKGITEKSITKYPAILLALCDPKKRAMLEFISSDLIRKGIGANTWYGIGGPDMEVVAELLEVTR